MTASFFIDVGPYVLGALVLALAALLVVGLCQTAASDRREGLPPAQRAGATAPASARAEPRPDLLDLSRGDEFMREWDIAAGEYFKEWQR